MLDNSRKNDHLMVYGYGMDITWKDYRHINHKYNYYFEKYSAVDFNDNFLNPQFSSRIRRSNFRCSINSL